MPIVVIRGAVCMYEKADHCLFLQDGRGQPRLSPPPLNYVNKQETTSLTESGLPRLACGLTFFFAALLQKNDTQSEK